MRPLREIESPILDEKQILSWKPKKTPKPGPRHPYKKKYFMEKLRGKCWLEWYSKRRQKTGTF